MEIRSYNLELAYANLMFSNIFRNITITKSINNVNKDIKVNCTFGQRSRILKNIQNKNKEGTYKLPLIIINRTGYNRNTERLNNINNEVKHELTSKYRKTDLLTPIPIDISYDVIVVAKSPSDIDQIASNFMVFFNGDVYVSCNHPKYDGIKLNNQIIMGDSISEEHLDELDGTQDDFITTTFTFTFKTYLFGGTQQAQLAHVKQISSYLSTYIDNHTISEIKHDDVLEWLETHPGQNVSVYISAEVTKEITSTYEISSETYDGFVPIINTLHIGFYPTPHLCSFNQFIHDVDNVYPMKWPYVSKTKWIIDPNSIYEFPDNYVPERIDVDGYYKQSYDKMISNENEFSAEYKLSCELSNELYLSVDENRIFIKPTSIE